MIHEHKWKIVSIVVVEVNRSSDRVSYDKIEQCVDCKSIRATPF